MSNLVTRFDELLKQMERALVANDVEQIRVLTEQQQSCLSEIVQSSSKTPDLKEELETAMPGIVRQIRLNEVLLNQAMTLSSEIINTLHIGISAQMPRQTNTRVYTA